MLRSLRLAPAAVLALALTASVTALADPGSGKDGSRPDTYTIPGDAVFPEGIALDHDSDGDGGDRQSRGRGKRFFVSSTTDGTIFRGFTKRAALEPFAPGGADGRTTATGLKVDGRDRLFAAGAATGKAFVLDADDGSTIKVLDAAPFAPEFGDATFINDVALAPGVAYFTDSRRPVVYRVTRTRDGVGDLEAWLDLRGTAFAYQDGFNANGIAAFDDGRILVVVQTNTGRLFRIDTRTRSVREIGVEGGSLTNGDGLLRHGSRVYVVRNAEEQVVEVKLRRDKRQGEVRETVTAERFAFPTTVARDGKRLLVVNAQFDRRGAPALPFTVAAVRRP